MRTVLSAVVVASGLVGSSQVFAATKTGTLEGTTTTLGGQLLNGMCPVLYDAKAKNELIDLAGTGTDGMQGHYIQTMVPVGKYTLFFYNCGANTGGNPDFNYTPIFFGSTWDPAKSTKVVISNGQTTMLGPQGVPVGGVVVGTVTDKTTKMPADSVPIIMVPPGGDKFFPNFAWTYTCTSFVGAYTTSFGYMQGVPQGARAYFGANGFGCTNSQGVYDAGFFKQAMSKPINIVVEGTVTVNGAVKENPPALRRTAPK
jgi:hypothetical protein